LLGAWCNVESANSALDIGCGTGLIALMLAQKKAELKIDAVEINAESAAEAEENVQNSPFKKQISVFCDSIQNFTEKCNFKTRRKKKYDLIVSNPPFFVDSLKNPDKNRALARHNDTLPYCDLIFAAEKLLSPNGSFSVILPENQCESFIDLAEKYNLFLIKQTEVFPTKESNCHRRLMLFSKKKSKKVFQKLTIENSRHDFTNEYISLTKYFYLKF